MKAGMRLSSPRVLASWVVAFAMTAALLIGSPARAANSIYVLTSATDTYDGTSWAKAYTNIQEALAVASNGDTIYVAGQTFILTNQLVWTKSGVSVRGGYEADPGGALPGNYDPEQWPTSLTRTGGPNHRILFINGANNSTLESVTVRGGNDARTSAPNGMGGGVYISGSSAVVLSGCVIESNACSYGWYGAAYGGGLYAGGSSVTLTNCIVRNNSLSGAHNTVREGGGIWSDGTLTILDSRILRNSVYISGEALSINSGKGGGVFFKGSSLHMKNTLVAGSRAYRTGSGDGIQVNAGAASLLNCTIADHPLGQSNAGQGLYRGAGTVALTNCIVWHNAVDIQGDATASHSNVGGHDYGGNNISADPLFEYGYYLATNSPSVDTGSDTAANLGLASRTTRADGANDTDTVDMGWHYAAGPDLTYAEVYVAPPPLGDDNANNGTSPATPFETIAKALSVVQDGSCIHVASGTYSTSSGESFPLTLADKTGVRIDGTNAADTILNATGSGVRVMTLTRLQRPVVSRLTLTGGQIPDLQKNADYKGGGLNVTDSGTVLLSGCIVSNNTIIRNWNAGIAGGGLYLANSDVILTNCLVRKNTVSNNRTDNRPGAKAGGIWSDGVLTAHACVIADNTAFFGGTASGDGGGLYFNGRVLGFRNVLLANNMARRDGDGLYARKPELSTYHPAGSSELQNCTVAGNAGQGICRSDGTVSVRDSILWGNGVDSTGTVTISWSCVSNSTDYVDGGGNTNANPLFVDTTYYHLQSQEENYVGGYFSGGAWAKSAAQSPCIDAGDETSDYSRELEPNGSRVNMGAYGNTTVASKTMAPPAGTLILLR